MNIKNWLKKISFSKGADALKMEITPFRDWKNLVLLFFIWLSVSLVFNIYMSIGVNRDHFFAEPKKVNNVEVLDTEGLKIVADQIDEKAANFEKAKSEKLTTADPSL
ncbi:hypothetical protein EPN27_00775 [Patescibacteria group bacterium]|nr:MAG: hypothetical protein EPN27_00775 [Patescibacteria group bacterium]